MADSTDEATDETTDPEPGVPRSTVDFDALANKLRSRVDLFGKSLVGLATLGTGAVGLKTVSDLAPRGPGSTIAALLAIAGLALAAWSAIVVAGQLMKVNQPVVMEVDLASFPDEEGFSVADAKAKVDVERIYTSTAQRYGYSTLLGLSERERQLRRASDRAGSDAEKARRVALADAVRTDVDEALARARWAVVRRRASDAAGGRDARTAYFGVAVGLLAFGFLSDIATANQDDNIAVAKACGEARDAGALAHDFQDTTCAKRKKAESADSSGDASESATPAVATPEAARTAMAKQLLAALEACNELVQPAGPLTPADCELVRVSLAHFVVVPEQVNGTPPTTPPAS